jgi:hypothetical protein
MRAAAKLLLLLFSGPVVALVVLEFGCMQPWQLLGVSCGHNAPISLVLFSVAVWVAIGAVLFVRDLLRPVK